MMVTGANDVIAPPKRAVAVATELRQGLTRLHSTTFSAQLKPRCAPLCVPVATTQVIPPSLAPIRSKVLKLS